jgi:hypothetical protein
MQVGNEEIGLVQVDAKLRQAIKHRTLAFFAVQACVYDEIVAGALYDIGID